MEVDDAEISSNSLQAKETVQESAPPEAAAENGRSGSRHSSRRHVPTPKTLAMVEDEEEPPELELKQAASSSPPQKADKAKHEKKEEKEEHEMATSLLTATPLKLHVSDDEDDDEGEEKEKLREDKMDVDDVEEKEEIHEQKESRKLRRTAAAARRQLLSSPRVAEDIVALDEEEGDEKSSDIAEGSGIKRKRYDVRSSSSEECLLGFDEQSGEAELVKNDDNCLLTPPAVATTPTDDEKKEEFEREALMPSPSASPRPIKKLKKNSTAKSPSPRAPSPPVSSKSPPQVTVKIEAPEKKPVAASLKSIGKNNKPKTLTPPLPQQVAQREQLAPPPPSNKQHIVGDNEDANGSATTTPAKPAPSTPVPAATATAAAAAIHISTPIPTSKPKPLSAQDDFYKKPFEFGWKRELVWRANMETSKDKADVYFITPAGKKLRTRSEIAPLLDGELTLEHFSFAREPLGVGPELELVRSAKPSTRVSVTAATLAAAASTPTNIGKRISKPKGPKGASPPPQGWTPTRALKVNNAALLSSASSSRYSAGFGGSAMNAASQSSRGASAASSGGGGSSGASSSKSSKAKKASSGSITGSSSANASSSGGGHEPCSNMCVRAPGQVPELQCVKCLCLFHSQCVGRLNSSEHRRRSGYICEACLPKVEQADKIVAAPERHNPPPPTTSTTASPPVRTAPSRVENKFQQSIAVLKGKKYVVVAKPIVATTTPAKHANDIENDLKQINESIRNSRKPSLVSMDAAFQPHTQIAAAPATTTVSTATAAVEPSNKLFATNFFANVSFAYDALISIIQYLKIHERSRAASVCKLWHLAAKDTSLWHTVRMKNSKVCSWSGFTAALRRGETKQLDLRKMLLASTRSEEMWQDFALHIGTVCSLEIIDLCRCSARVVEGLFQSNKQLRVLNAVAINDDHINLEHIGLLTALEELRLRSCEPAVLVSDLQPLQSLTGLAHLSLTAIRGLGAKTVSVLGDLTALRSLELGECGDFDGVFAEAVLPRLVNLQRLRLENGLETGCCTLAILGAAAQLKQLSQLELVNFDIKPGFDEKLRQCSFVRKLLIIPTYISQSATTNHIVLSAVQQVAHTLQVFTWGVTVELLRVTALYVDQCEESTKKEKHHFDECIPVLKPVPGAPPADNDDDKPADGEKTKTVAPPPVTDDLNASSEVPQIEILPLDKVEFILGENLPQTKFTIVKIPYHATCKQQLVE